VKLETVDAAPPRLEVASEVGRAIFEFTLPLRSRHYINLRDAAPADECQTDYCSTIIVLFVRYSRCLQQSTRVVKSRAIVINVCTHIY